MSCLCDYSTLINAPPCITCVNVANVNGTKTITQKRIWGQVRAPASLYAMNLGSLTSAASRLNNQNNVNWNQMSDRVLPAKQKTLIPTHGNSLHSTLTSDRPGAATPGGAGVDVKHDSYARYLNRKKAATLKTQTKHIATVPLAGNKTKAMGLLANSSYCCP
jgi:hypothetical protein